MSDIDASLPYAGLGPDTVLDAVEAAGFRCDGRLLQLNSFENRVYQVGVGENEWVVAKFYRSGRWSDAAILEEHSFTAELGEHEIPVVSPLVFDGGETLLLWRGFRYSLFPKKPGRTPELEDFDTLKRIGRFMGRIHAVGRAKAFKERPALNVSTFGEESLSFLKEGGFVPDYLAASYFTVADEVLRLAREGYQAAGVDPAGVFGIRLHGDCHAGNILWTDAGPHFVDFDDCRTGPAVQDLWMLLSGERGDREAALEEVLEGYSDFSDFNPRELSLIEPLRALRQLHHSAWLARRYDDPAFKSAFPWFAEPRYWESQVLALREQASLLMEPPLELS